MENNSITLPTVHPNKVAFGEGVSLILYSWTALRLAIEMEWGGIDSVNKRDWMIEVIVDYFDKQGKNIIPEDIEDMLIQIMVDEFNVNLDDDSAYQIGQDIVRMYGECIHGNFTTVERLRK